MEESGITASSKLHIDNLILELDTCFNLDEQTLSPRPSSGRKKKVQKPLDGFSTRTSALIAKSSPSEITRVRLMSRRNSTTDVTPDVSSKVRPKTTTLERGYHPSQRRTTSSPYKRSKSSPGTRKREKEYPSEPHFELCGSYSLGYARNFIGLRTHSKVFVPGYNQLKRHGGKSIQLYEDWRRMQFKLNSVMKKFLSNHGVNLSVLPPCEDYSYWKSEEWRRLYKVCTKRALDEDPCPDCDVRLYKDSTKRNKFIFKIAPSSVLEMKRWSKRRFLNTVLIIGLPQHITIACVREHADHIIFEYFDPAGPSGDTQSHRAVRQWADTFLADLFSVERKKTVKFECTTKSICFQSDKMDVMCQTWIWYWVYWRMVRQADASEIIKHIKKLIHEKQSLKHIRIFHTWMMELHHLRYIVPATASEKADAVRISPPSLTTLRKMHDTMSLGSSTIIESRPRTKKGITDKPDDQVSTASSTMSVTSVQDLSDHDQNNNENEATTSGIQQENADNMSTGRTTPSEVYTLGFSEDVSATAKKTTPMAERVKDTKGQRRGSFASWTTLEGTDDEDTAYDENNNEI